MACILGLRSPLSESYNMQITEQEEKLIKAIRQMDVDYGEVHLQCTYSRGNIAKVNVVNKTHTVLMN